MASTDQAASTQSPAQISPALAILEGNKRLAAEDFKGAEAAFTLAVNSSQNAAALYGLGIVAFSRRDWSKAAEFFEKVVAADPNHANAMCYRAAVAQEVGEPVPACDWLNRALTLQPDHQLARKRRAWLWTDSRFRKLTQSDGKPHDFESLGVYAHLLDDPTLLSAQCVVALRHLRIASRPPLHTHFGMVGAWLSLEAQKIVKGKIQSLITLALLVVVVAAFTRVPTDTTKLMDALSQVGTYLASLIVRAIVLILVSCIGWALLRAATTTVTIDKGRLQVHSGVFHRKRINIELWRVQSAELRQSVVHRVFGSGYLRLTLHSGEVVLVPGPSPTPDLAQVYQELLDLIYLLRANPVIKGIIY
jgi:membrane protein YdbS with pleckstrin-like domain